MIARITRRLRQKRIVILGGGFGGVYAAIHLEKLLARDSAVEICLVSRDNFFLFTPMLHEIAASDLEITNIVNPLRKLLRKVEVLVGDVNQIDLPNKRALGNNGDYQVTARQPVHSSMGNGLRRIEPLGTERYGWANPEVE
jgi:NADH dehydrogenase FAD-containing subunit